ncbi:iduronate sulfatase [Caulobacter radicis]|uniref:superinfection immunity protein n=1 Tax=Caulobacter radicis TaxID=2172650 RepID=UPI000D574DD1|nr:superinfection immunity protein [Caulobacter radicis]PVM88189.1 iduronate sulfatase [Caulobacter radicis]
MQDLSYWALIYGAAIVQVVLAGLVYLIPFWAASSRGHPRKMSILALNLLLGWTMVGWAAALIWALTRPSPRELPEDEQILRFAGLRDQGLITEAEFLAKKQQILGSPA